MRVAEQKLRPVVLVDRLRFAFHAIAFATATLSLPTRASAQLGVSGGVDGGLSFVHQNQELVDPTAQRHNAIPTLGLGIDVAFYYMFNAQIGLGFAFAPAFFGAGAAPTPGLNFAFSPRVLWRPGPVSLTLESGFVLSAFGDRCDADWKPVTEGCQPLRPAEPAGPGFGAAVS